MAYQPSQPGKWQLLRIWASISLQSFGGGTSTTYLMQRAFIERSHFMTAEEFTHCWNLCLLTPGSNLIALTILIGKRAGGVPGIVVSLAGLLLPGALITCVLAALFTQIEHVQAVMHGIVPATDGIMLVVGFNFAQPLLRKSVKEGALLLLANSAVIVSCVLAVIFLQLSAIVVVIGAICPGALCFSPKTGPAPLNSERQGQQCSTPSSTFLSI
ncbi:MAG TPA: chromate transporter [Ktedonobacteraceae bacterium]